MGVFKKLRSTVVVNRRAFFIIITPSGFAVWSLMSLCPSLKVFGFAFFKKRMGFGATPHINSVFFLLAFSFALAVSKEKAVSGLDFVINQIDLKNIRENPRRGFSLMFLKST